MRKPTAQYKRKGVIFINRKDLPEANATCQTCGHRYRICNKCLEMKSRGIETWRQHCDCIECYEIYVFLNQDPSRITKEEFDRAAAIELPVGQEMTKEVKDKFNAIRQRFVEEKKVQEVKQETQTKYDKKQESKRLFGSKQNR